MRPLLGGDPPVRLRHRARKPPLPAAGLSLLFPDRAFGAGIAFLHVFQPVFVLRNFKAHLFPGHGVQELQPAGVEREPVEGVGPCPVVLVPCQGAAQEGEVGAYLVFLAGVQGQLKERVGRPPCDDSVMGHGADSLLQPFVPVLRDVGDVVGILGEGLVYRPRLGKLCFAPLPAGRVLCDRPVDLAGVAVVPAGDELPLGGLAEGKDHHPARVPVQSVDDERPVALGPSSPAPKYLFDCLQGGSGLAAWVGHGEHPRGLLDDDDVLVLVQNPYPLPSVVGLVLPLVGSARLDRMEAPALSSHRSHRR